MEKYKRILEENYKLAKINSIEKINIKSTNDLYKIKTAKGKLFLKEIKVRRLIKLPNILTEIDIAEHLKEKGLRTIYPIKTKKGERAIEVDDYIYILYPFFNVDKEYIMNEDRAEFAAKTLAQLHQHLESFKEGGKFHTKPMHTETVDITFFTEYHPRVKREAVLKRAREQDTPFSKKVVENSEFINEIISKILTNLKDCEFTKQSILHYDFNVDNLMFKDGKFFAVTDFEYSHKGYIETDVAKTGRYWSEDKKDATIDFDKFKKFVRNYNKHNNCSLDWKSYHTLLIYAIMRRLVHAADYVLDNKADIEFLFDYDLKMIKFLIDNEEEFKKD